MKTGRVGKYLVGTWTFTDPDRPQGTALHTLDASGPPEITKLDSPAAAVYYGVVEPGARSMLLLHNDLDRSAMSRQAWDGSGRLVEQGRWSSGGEGGSYIAFDQTGRYFAVANAKTGWAVFRNGEEPDLIGYSIWVIFFTLGFFTLWALISWAVSIAPMLVLLENCGPGAALARSLRLGKPFTSKLVEINLVMGIVKLALLVLAMVFSSVLIPFSQEIGAGALHLQWVIVSLFYFIASDYFHVVRLKGFIEFWRVFRSTAP